MALGPTAKALLYSFIGLTALISLGTLFSAVSNVSTHFSIKKGVDGSRRSAEEEADDLRRNFYEDGSVVPDRIIDPRDSHEHRERHWGTIRDAQHDSINASVPSSIPVLALPLGHSLDFQAVHYKHQSLRKRVYELVGVQEGGFGYEVKVSFLGSPPVNFDLKLLTLPREGAGKLSCELCECEQMIDPSSSTVSDIPKVPNTRRKLADTEKVMFRSAPIGAAEAAFEYERSRTKKNADVPGLCCCTPGQLKAKDSQEFASELEAVSWHPDPAQQGQEGVAHINRMVVLDKTIAIPYEKEHVVRHFETVKAAERAMGVRFLVPSTPTEGSTSQANRLFVVVSAYPKGVAESHSAPLFSSTVQFNIKLEQLYLGGQFPIGIIIGLALVWPVCNVFLIVFLPRFMDIVKGVQAADKEKQS